MFQQKDDSLDPFLVLHTGPPFAPFPEIIKICLTHECGSEQVPDRNHVGGRGEPACALTNRSVEDLFVFNLPPLNMF